MQVACCSHRENRLLHDFEAWMRAMDTVEVTVLPHFQFLLEAEMPMWVCKHWVHRASCRCEKDIHQGLFHHMTIKPKCLYQNVSPTTHVQSCKAEREVRKIYVSGICELPGILYRQHRTRALGAEKCGFDP